MSGAGFGIPNSAGDFASKLEGDGDVKLGDSSGDVIQITGSVEINENLFFLSSGKIGIGDSDPSYKLSVGGSMEVGQYIYHNENSTDIDFRVESNQNTHMFHIDGQNQRIGIGTNSAQTLLHIVDPFDSIAGSESDAVVIIKSKKEVGIKLIADSGNDNSGGENNNPFIDFYQDGASDGQGRNQRLASIAMEGDAGTTFTGSLANALHLDAFHPLQGHSNRPLQLANASTNNGHKARITLEGTNGYVGVWTSTPSHPLEVEGAIKAITNITAPATQDLGSGTSSTLSIGSSLMFLDADSITGIDLGIGQDVHTLNLPNGTTSGQKLTLVIEGNMGAGNSVPIMLAGNLIGAFDMFMPGSKTSLNFVYYSTSSISAWYQL